VGHSCAFDFGLESVLDDGVGFVVFSVLVVVVERSRNFFR
jgi:NhaP-type Na+/H+ or K+/H+ antiporter